jgi:hypothetical protein
MCAGSLERNLLPLVESEALQALAVQAQPVQVAVSGVAFPHPEKVRCGSSSSSSSRKGASSC